MCFAYIFQAWEGRVTKILRKIVGGVEKLTSAYLGMERTKKTLNMFT